METKQRQNNTPNSWQQAKLGEVFEFKNGVNSEKANYGSGIRFINIMEVIHNDFLVADDIPGRISLDQKTIKNNHVEYGDVLFNRTSETPEEIGLTATYLDSEPVVFGGFVIRARPTGNHLDNNYKKFCFSSRQIRREIIRRGQGAIRANIGQSDLEKVPLVYPLLPEQKRIVGVLEIWDETIAKLTRKIELKKNVKKGLMQQLLTGKSRLPGFTDEWQTVKLGNVCEITMGQSPSSTAYNENANGLPLIQGNNDIKKRKTIQRVWTTEITKIADAGNIVMTVRAPVGCIGVTVERVCIGRGVCSIAPLKIDRLFTLKLLEHYETRWKSFEQGSTFLAVNSSDVKGLQINVPASQEEQTAIANILITADNEIVGLDKKLTLLKDQKKYLLNNLITGLIRTPEDLLTKEVSKC